MGEIIGNGYYSPGYATPDPIESECLEVYELNLEKNKGKGSGSILVYLIYLDGRDEVSESSGM